MKDVREMSYGAMQDEVITNRCAIRSANADEKRKLIHRNHDLLVEMDRRWAAAARR